MTSQFFCFPDQQKLCKDNYVKPGGSSVAVYPDDRDRFQMTDAAPISAGMRSNYSKEALIVGIMAITCFYNL